MGVRVSFSLVIASLCFRKQVHVLVEHCFKKIFCVFVFHVLILYVTPVVQPGVGARGGLYMMSRLYKTLCL